MTLFCRKPLADVWLRSSNRYWRTSVGKLRQGAAGTFKVTTVRLELLSLSICRLLMQHFRLDRFGKDDSVGAHPR